MSEAAAKKLIRVSPTSRPPQSTGLQWLLLLTFGLLLAACGGSTDQNVASAAFTAGQQNHAQLDLSDIVTQTEMLDAKTGAITTLADVVIGDRPVVVWYWAPN